MAIAGLDSADDERMVKVDPANQSADQTQDSPQITVEMPLSRITNLIDCGPRAATIRSFLESAEKGTDIVAVLEDVQRADPRNFASKTTPIMYDDKPATLRLTRTGEWEIYVRDEKGKERKVKDVDASELNSFLEGNIADVTDTLALTLGFMTLATLQRAGYSFAKKVEPGNPARVLFDAYLKGLKVSAHPKVEGQMLFDAASLPDGERSYAYISYVLDKVGELGTRFYLPLLILHDKLVGKSRDYEEFSLEDIVGNGSRSGELRDFFDFLRSSQNYSKGVIIEKTDFDPILGYTGQMRIFGNGESAMKISDEHLEKFTDKYPLDVSNPDNRETIMNYFGNPDMSGIIVYEPRYKELARSGNKFYLNPKLTYNINTNTLTLTATGLDENGNPKERSESLKVNWDKVILAYNSAAALELI